MDRTLAEQPIGCRGRTVAVLLYGHILKWRCREKACPDCRQAKQRNEWSFHLRDLETGHQWTEYQPAHPGKE